MDITGFSQWWSRCLAANNQLLMPVPMHHGSRLYSPELSGRWRPKIDPVVLHENYKDWANRYLIGKHNLHEHRTFVTQMCIVGCTLARSRFGSREPRRILVFGPVEDFQKCFMV